MNKETYSAIEYSYNIIKGILFANQEFEKGNVENIIYDFDCPEYEILRNKYNLKRIAKSGTDFDKAKRLLTHFAKRLTHESMYDNHVPCNAIDLLEYSYCNKEHGINCLNKSKILTEVCLAIGIKARRVTILPYSIYDMDNHVVTEIFDTSLNKWIMIDPTTDAYFIDENKTPLSMLEIRENFAENKFITFVHPSDKLDNLDKLSEKYLYMNWYICKNSFALMVDKYQGFGEDKKEILYFFPKGFSYKQWIIDNFKYRISYAKLHYPQGVKMFEDSLKKLQEQEEQSSSSINTLK